MYFLAQSHQNIDMAYCIPQYPYFFASQFHVIWKRKKFIAFHNKNRRKHGWSSNQNNYNQIQSTSVKQGTQYCKFLFNPSFTVIISDKYNIQLWILNIYKKHNPNTASPIHVVGRRAPITKLSHVIVSSSPPRRLSHRMTHADPSSCESFSAVLVMVRCLVEVLI